MAWIYLTLAILLEVFATTMMKLSNGMTEVIPSVMMFIGYILCFTLLSFALKTIDMSIAYAIWCAVGIVVVAAIGILFFHENINTIKILSTILIIAGVIGLKLSS